MAAVGVIVPEPVKIVKLPAINVSAVVATVKPALKLVVQPEVVVKTGAVAPPKVSEGAVPLKFTVPVLDTVMVPLADPMVKEELNVKVPVVTEITSVATTVLAIQVTVPAKVKLPVLTVILPILVAIALTPVKIRLPVTVPVPALMIQAVVTAAVGWLIVTLPLTVKVGLFPALCVKELAAPLALNVNPVQV